MSSSFELWRRTRHPRAAALVDSPDRPAIGQHAAWLEVAALGDPFDTPRLLAALQHTSSRQGLERLRALDARDDPFVVPGLIALLRNPPSKSIGSRPLWTYVLARLTATRDPRAKAELERVRADIGTIMPSTTGDWLRVAIDKTLPALAAELPLSPADEAAIRARERELGIVAARPVVDVATLLAQVYADPDADGPREVYADAVGGEAGAFVIEQLRGSTAQPPPAIARRQLGALAGIVTRAHFVRGFPERVSVWTRASAVKPHVGLPAWSTVRAIEIGSVPYNTKTAAAALLGHPVMQLDELDGVPAIVLARLLRAPWHERVAMLGVVVDKWLPDIAPFRALRLLKVIAWHAEAFALPSLGDLDLEVLTNDVVAWWRRAADAGARRLDAQSWARCRLRFTRTDTGLDDLMIEASLHPRDSLSLLALLPVAAVRRLHVRGVPAADVAQAAARFRLDVLDVQP